LSDSTKKGTRPSRSERGRRDPEAEEGPRGRGLLARQKRKSGGQRPKGNSWGKTGKGLRNVALIRIGEGRCLGTHKNTSR